MRGITSLIISVIALGGVMLVIVPLFDTMVPFVQERTTGYDAILGNIHVAMVKWVVVVFIFTMLIWAVLWILRQERQQV